MSILTTLKNSPIFAPKNVKLFTPKTFNVYVSMCVHRDVNAQILKLGRFLELCPNPKIKFDIMDGDALIARSRGRVATHFLLKELDKDVLMFIDDDITFDPLDLVKTVRLVKEQNLDIVGGMYLTKRENNPVPTFMPLDPNQEFVFGKGAFVQEVMFLSTGFFAIHRRVLEKMVESGQIPLCHINQETTYYPFFQTENRKVREEMWALSEDWSFCARARDLGFKVWLNCEAKIGHIGKRVYNWDDIGRPIKEIKETARIKFGIK